MNIIETNLNFNSNYSIRNGNPPGYVLHHAAADGSVYDVHNWHLANGWAGIGYHFYVRKDGSVYRGRPENWIGAHTVGHNSKIGICAEGNFEIDLMGAAQRNAIIELLDYLYEKYGNLEVYGHRDLDSTDCPGKNYPFAEIVSGKKAETEEQQPAVDPNAVTVTLTTLGKGDEGEQVKTLQRLLVYFGYAIGDYGERNDGVDGYFEGATENAVKKFQQENGLTVDGLVGEDTWSCILGV